MITQHKLKQMFKYEPETGKFTRRIDVKRSKAKAGDEPKYFIDRDGYKRFKIAGTVYLAHRLAWLYMTGKFPDGVIDHIDHNRGNNAFSNIRDTTHLGNQRNRSLNRNSKTKVTGVCRSNAKSESWRAYIKVGGKTIALGVFKDIDDAINARKKAEIQYGFHENHGGVSLN